MKNKGDYLYRAYFNFSHTNWDSPVVDFTKYVIVKITPKGYWVRNSIGSLYPRTESPWDAELKWVSKDGKKVFARETKKRALFDLKCRTKIRKCHMERKLYDIKRVLNKIDIMMEKEYE